MLIPGPLGPVIGLGGPPDPTGLGLEYDVRDCFLLREDCAFVVINVTNGTTNDFFTRFQVFNPLTGALIAQTDTETFHIGDTDVMSYTDPCMVAVDAHTAFFVVWPPFFSTEQTIWAGRFSDNGGLVLNSFLPPYTFRKNKSPFYGCWDPIKRQFSIQGWTHYFIDPAPRLKGYGLGIDVDTLEIADTWEMFYDQETSFFAYYESFPTTFPGYGGSLLFRGVHGSDPDRFGPGEDDGGAGGIYDNTGRLLYKVPFKLPLTDEVWIQQCSDDPFVIAITWQEYYDWSPGDPPEQNWGLTSCALFQIYPTWKQLSGPVVIGQYRVNNQGPNPPPPSDSTLQQFLNFNFFDLPRMYSTKSIMSTSWSAFGATQFRPDLGHDGFMPLGIRDLSSYAAWSYGGIDIPLPHGDHSFFGPFQDTNGIGSQLGGMIFLAGEDQEFAVGAKHSNWGQLFGLKKPALRISQRGDDRGSSPAPRIGQATGKASRAPRIGGVNTLN